MARVFQSRDGDLINVPTAAMCIVYLWCPKEPNCCELEAVIHSSRLLSAGNVWRSSLLNHGAAFWSPVVLRDGVFYLISILNV